MYDLSTSFTKFHDSHVKLSEEEKSKLREFKELNLNRLKEGLSDYNEEKSTNIKVTHVYEQGSVAMSTLTQNEHDDYDIDIAVCFNETDLPSDPEEARVIIEDALRRKCFNFSKRPTARTNAVTVWYKEGYHIDFAVNRFSKKWGFIDTYEHAGKEWVERNPTEIKNWFIDTVSEKSPDENNGATVRLGQMRRIVRLLKMFARSRLSWSLPGGMILTALVSECYKPDKHRDDVAFYDTMVAIKNRLSRDLSVYNPVHRDQLLNYNEKITNKIRRLHDKLEKRLVDLSVLKNTDCDKVKGQKAWSKFFNHEYWVNEATSQSRLGTLKHAADNYRDTLINIEVMIYSQEDSSQPPLYQLTRGRRIPKNLWIRFKANHQLDTPYSIEWIVENEGDEAEDAQDLMHSRQNENNPYHWEHTLYRGRHKMTCVLIKNNKEYGRKTVNVNIL